MYVCRSDHGCLLMQFIISCVPFHFADKKTLRSFSICDTHWAFSNKKVKVLKARIVVTRNSIQFFWMVIFFYFFIIMSLSIERQRNDRKAPDGLLFTSLSSISLCMYLIDAPFRNPRLRNNIRKKMPSVLISEIGYASCIFGGE